jgi:hypothetical protein
MHVGRARAQQEKLIAIVEPLLRETEYLVQRYHEVSAAGTSVHRRMHRKVVRPCNAVPFADFARELATTRAGLVRPCLARNRARA